MQSPPYFEDYDRLVHEARIAVAESKALRKSAGELREESASLRQAAEEEVLVVLRGSSHGVREAVGSHPAEPR